MSEKSPLKNFFKYATTFKKRIYTASFFSVLNKILDIAPPILIGMAVDVVVEKEQSLIAGWGFPSLKSQIFILAALTVLIWGLESLTEYIFSVMWRNLAQDIQHKMRTDAYAHMQNLDLQFFENKSSGELMSILNDDINQLERFLDVGANKIIQIITSLLFIGGIFFYLVPEIAVFSFLPIPFIIWGSLYFQRKIAPHYKNIRQEVGHLNQKLANNIGGILTIKSYTTENFENKNISAHSENYIHANQKAIRISSAATPLIRVVIVIGFLFILVQGAFAVDNGVLAVGSYSMMVFLIQRLLWPFRELGDVVDLFQRAMASVNRLLSLLHTPIHIQPGNTPLSLQLGEGQIKFENVNFSYIENHPVLKNLSFKFEAGKTTGIVGTTGSGKSTLIKLILRLYEPQSGSIAIENQNLKDLSLQTLRKHIALVSQDVFLFHGSVKDNIAYGNPNASHEEIMKAAKIAEAHDFITSLPQGYDTIVGERGIKLSGGQRQRVSIARAVLKDAPILILDEATSSVDNETEAAIQRSLDLISKDRTTIILAHRLSTIRHAHQIFVLENGEVAEQGTHEKLVGLDGIYNNLWQVQTGESAHIPSRQQNKKIS